MMRARLLLLHHRQHVLAGQEHAFEIGVDLGVPDLFRHFHRPAGRRPADIVHQDVDAAEMPDTSLHHRGDGGTVGDVAGMHDDFAACSFHFVDRLARAVAIAVDRKNPGALLGETHRGGAAIAPAGANAAGAGDDGDPALQTSAHDPSLRAGAKR